MADPALIQTLIDLGCKPIGCDKHGYKWNPEDGIRLSKRMVKSGTFFTVMVGKMVEDSEKAIEVVDEVEKRFSQSIERFRKTEDQFVAQSKKASGSIRDSANKLSESFLKMQKAADFDKLERYVELLERASKAMTVLADLDKDGKLAKLSQALK